MRNKQWMRYLVFLNVWQKVLLCFLVPLAFLFFCYWFIFIYYQQEIVTQQSLIFLNKTRINQTQSTLYQSPSMASLKALQDDYVIPHIHHSANKRLHHLFSEPWFMPDTWENTLNSNYKLSFTLPYFPFLTLLKRINQAGFSLTSLDVQPIQHNLLAVQLHLIDLNTLVKPVLSHRGSL